MKQQERFEAEIAWSLKVLNPGAVKEVYKDLTILKGEKEVWVNNKVGGRVKEVRPMMKVYSGKSAKPISYYHYASIERRDRELAVLREAANSREAYKAQIKEEKANLGLPTSKVGDLFVSSWGYDQTNVDYYQVVERPSAHYAIVRRIDSKIDSISTSGDYNVSASKGNFSERYPDAMRVKLSKNGGYGESFRVASYANAYSCKESDSRYETGPYNGH